MITLARRGSLEIHTPEDRSQRQRWANLFKLSYFDKTGSSAQSPQFYKQMMVGVLTVYLRLALYSVQRSITQNVI